MASRDPWQDMRGNACLRSLPAREAFLLRGSLRRTQHRAGEVISTDADDTLLFPETLVACLIGTRSASAIGMIGREGLLGWNRLFSAHERGTEEFVTLCNGTALAISGSRLRKLMAANPSLALTLLPSFHAFTEQMRRTIVSTMHASLEARVSNWLLMMHERIGDEIQITHQMLANFLNVRRASVTDALHVLEGEGALRSARGRITIRKPDVLVCRAAVGIPAGYRPAAAARPRSPAPGMH